LIRSPTATIGKTERWNQKARILSAQSPGPNSYQKTSLLKRGPSAVMGNAKAFSTTRFTGPGPSDYNISYRNQLKNNPRITIGNGKKDEREMKERAKSPGPDHYSPNRLKLKKRNVTIIFDQAKREGMISKNSSQTPGPGSYMVPCRFYDRPKFMLKTENKFRYV
jgi:hypothetical protein